MVSAYLIQVCRLSVQEALACFGSARPPGVKHEKFVVELSRCAVDTSLTAERPTLMLTYRACIGCASTGVSL